MLSTKQNTAFKPQFGNILRQLATTILTSSFKSLQHLREEMAAPTVANANQDTLKTKETLKPIDSGLGW